MLSRFPDKSKVRLAGINDARKVGFKAHIAMAAAMGVIDRHIRQVNELIRSLVKAKKEGSADTPEALFAQEKAEEKLDDLRIAIDQVCVDFQQQQIRTQEELLENMVEEHRKADQKADDPDGNQ